MRFGEIFCLGNDILSSQWGRHDGSIFRQLGNRGQSGPRQRLVLIVLFILTSYFYSVWNHSPKDCHSNVRGCLPTSINLIQKPPHRHAQRVVFMVMLNPKGKIKSYYHNCLAVKLVLRYPIELQSIQISFNLKCYSDQFTCWCEINLHS